MPALGVSTPAITSELGGICRVIFTNRSTVEEFDSQHEKFRNGREYIYHWKEGTRRRGSRKCCAVAECCASATYCPIFSMCQSRLVAWSIQQPRLAPPQMFAASRPSRSSVTLLLGIGWEVLAFGRRIRAGTEKSAHQTLEPSMANLCAVVDPPASWTRINTTSSSKIPAMYLRAIPSEYTHAVAWESFSVSL